MSKERPFFYRNMAEKKPSSNEIGGVHKASRGVFEEHPVPNLLKETSSEAKTTASSEVIILIPCGGSLGPEKIIGHLPRLRKAQQKMEGEEALRFKSKAVVVANMASFSQEAGVRLKRATSTVSWVELLPVSAAGFGETLKLGLEALSQKYPHQTIVVFEDDGVSLANYEPFIREIREKGLDIVLKVRSLKSRFNPCRGPFRWLFSFLDISSNCVLGLPREVHFGAGRLGVLTEAFSKSRTAGWVTEKEAYLAIKSQGVKTSQILFSWQDDPRSSAASFQAIAGAAKDYLRIFQNRLGSKYSGK